MFVHVFGVVIIIAILVFVPDDHQSVDFVFTERINNSGFSMDMFWFYVLPLGFLLTQYTITGFDASAHISEETHGASRSAATRSLAIDLLLGGDRLVRAPGDHVRRDRPGGRHRRRGLRRRQLARDLQPLAVDPAFKAVVLISTIGQLFCGLACLTSASRMCFAFSRDHGLPASDRLSKVNASGTPRNAVITMAVPRC